MIDCISVENMRQSDQFTIAHFTSGSELMYRAAYGVFLSGIWQGAVAILAGSGNNGGDGFALACILAEQGIACTVFTMSNKMSADSAFYAKKAAESGVSILPFDAEAIAHYDILVDCLLGTGFHGAVRADYRVAIEAINAADAYVISVDINSGMNGDTGEADIAVISDLTVTIGYVKRGLVTENARRYLKRLVCVDIGITLVQEEWKILTPAEWQTSTPDPCHILCPEWLDMDVRKAY